MRAESVLLAVDGVCGPAYGLSGVWSGVWKTYRRARLPPGFSHLITAMAIHGAYSGIVVAVSAAGLHF